MFKLDLYPDEKVIQTYRQSEWILAKAVLILLLGIYLPWFFLIQYGLHVQFRYYLLTWTALLLLWFLNKWLLWLLKCYIVTDKRLIIVIYKNLLQKVVIETPLDRILNVSFGTKGVLQSLLGFGDVYLQVSGIEDTFAMENVKNASRIKDFLWKLIEAV